MPKLLQLSVTANWDSTGKIAEGIGLAAIARGWESTIAYGRTMNPSKSNLIKVGNRFDIYAHYARSLFFDKEGLGCRKSTRKLINQVEKLRPDIIHLHNIHGHWLNYPLLFEYLASIETPVVWTFHDCWPFTGHCPHFIFANCEKWKIECDKCPLRRDYPTSLFLDSSRNNYKRKSKIFTATKDLTVVSVSHWLENLIRKSFFRDNKIITIYNGIDLDTFSPKNTNEMDLGLPKIQHMILGVANIWSDRKGLDDFYKLNQLLPDNYTIVLIGLNEKQIKNLPKGIIGLKRTNSLEDLAALYSKADVVVSLSKAETFGLTLTESMACGTPVVAYASTALTELISPETGITVEIGNVKEVADSVRFIIENREKFSPENTRHRVATMFNRDVQFGKYIELYESLLNNNRLIQRH